MVKEFFSIFDWMVEKGLSGNELVCYAYLCKETAQGEKSFTGGYEKIAKAIGVTFPTAYNVLKKMKEKGLVQYESVTEISVVCE